MGSFTYQGWEGGAATKVTAVQLADDTLADLIIMVGTRLSESLEIVRQDTGLATMDGEVPGDLTLVWQHADGRRFRMSHGDLLLSLDDNPYDYTVMSPAMFGALFRKDQ